MAQGDALERAWRLYRDEWRDVLAVTALAYAGVIFVSAILLFTIGPLGLIPAAYVWLASLYWLQAPMARLVEDKRAGGKWRGARATVRSIYPQLGRITGGGSLVALIVSALLSSFLLAPVAFYFMTRWALLVPVIAVEDVGLFTAFSRAREIGKGHAWELFARIALSVLLIVLVWIGIGIVTAVLALFDVPLWVSLGGFALVALLALVLTTPLIALSWTMSYYELRDQVPREVVREPRLRGGRTLDTAWDAYSARPGRLILLCAPAALVISAVQIGVSQLHVGLALPVSVALFVALAGIVAAGLDGLDTTPLREWLRATARNVVPRLVPLLATAVVLAFALTITIPVLVGLFLVVRWSVAGPASVVERAGAIAALRRSNELVKGQGRRATKVLFVSGLVVVATLLMLAGLGPTEFPFAAYALLVAANVVAAPYVALAWAYMHRVLVRLPRDQPAAAVAA